MRTPILVLGAVGSMFAITAAGATGLGKLSHDQVQVSTSGTLSVDTSRCDDPFNFTFVLDDSGEQITAVVVRDAAEKVSPSCTQEAGAVASITLGEKDDLVAGGDNLDDRGTATVKLEKPFDVAARGGYDTTLKISFRR